MNEVRTRLYTENIQLWDFAGGAIFAGTEQEENRVKQEANRDRAREEQGQSRKQAGTEQEANRDRVGSVGGPAGYTGGHRIKCMEKNIGLGVQIRECL